MLQKQLAGTILNHTCGQNHRNLIELLELAVRCTQVINRKIWQPQYIAHPVNVLHR